MKLHTSNFKLYISNFKLHTSQFKLQTSHFKLHTSHFKLHTSHFKLEQVHIIYEVWSLKYECHHRSFVVYWSSLLTTMCPLWKNCTDWSLKPFWQMENRRTTIFSIYFLTDMKLYIIFLVPIHAWCYSVFLTCNWTNIMEKSKQSSKTERLNVYENKQLIKNWGTTCG